jgi:hypothetical protein
VACLAIVMLVGVCAEVVAHGQESAKTYKWVLVGGSGHADQVMAAQVREAVDSQLATKGLTKTDGPSDYEVEYWVEVQPERFSVANGSSMNMGVGGGVRSAPRTIPASETLRLDIYDAKTRKLVWEGTVTKGLDENRKPEKRQKDIDKAVGKLLKKYPAAAK